MDITEHIAALERDGNLLAVAAERAGLGASVPSCPPWRVRDLLRHIGYVHRWAAGYVAEQRTEQLPDEPSESEVLSSGPPDAELVDWFRAGHAALLRTLRTADPAVACWTVVPGPSPLAAWARRQAHETAIHRVDAELAEGGITPFNADFAADGIDELIIGILGRDRAGLSPAQRTGQRLALQVLATDSQETGDTSRRGTSADPDGGESPGAWLIELTAEGSLAARVARGTGPADCTLAGPAAALYPLMWNRTDPDSAGVIVRGDQRVLQAWRNGARLRWE